MFLHMLWIILSPSGFIFSFSSSLLFPLLSTDARCWWCLFYFPWPRCFRQWNLDALRRIPWIMNAPAGRCSLANISNQSARTPFLRPFVPIILLFHPLPLVPHPHPRRRSGWGQAFKRCLEKPDRCSHLWGRVPDLQKERTPPVAKRPGRASRLNFSSPILSVSV